MRAASIAVLALVGAMGSCSLCKRADTSTQPTEPILPVHPTPVAPDVSFTSWRNDSSVALPRGCKLAPPVLRAPKQGHKTRFALSAGAPEDLALAWSAAPDAGVDLFAHGIVSLDLKRAPRDITWFEHAPAPLFAAAKGRWLALLEAPGEAGPKQLILAREGAADERLAVGDQLHAADLVCTGARCAALTSKVGAVIGPGATLFSGMADAPAATWSRTELASEQQGAAPLAIASLDEASGEASVVLTAAGKATLMHIKGGQPTARDSLETHFGAMDAVEVQGRLLLASLGRQVDERGCSGAGGKVIVQAGGGEPVALELTAPPRGAIMRPLANGAVLAWLSPVNCLNADRWIVHALVLDASGRPSGSPMAVADASGFALVAQGDAVELALDTPEHVMVLRASCSP